MHRLDRIAHSELAATARARRDARLMPVLPPPVRRVAKRQRLTALDLVASLAGVLTVLVLI